MWPIRFVQCYVLYVFIWHSNTLPATAGHVVPTFLHRRADSTTGGGALDGAFLHVDSEAFHAPKRLQFSGRSAAELPLGKLASNQSVISDGDDVILSWSDVSDPAETDWIAVYCPANTTDENFLDYFPVTVAESWRQGRGAHLLKLFNMRQEYEFRYYRTAGGRHVEAAARLRIRVNPYEPCHGHLALYGDLDEMSLTWTSSCDDVVTVQYSLDKEFRYDVRTINNSAVARETYSAAQMCGEPANITSAIFFRNPGCQFTAVMSELQLASLYYYRYGSTLRGGAVKSAYFRSQHPPTYRKRVRFIAFGDMGVQYHPFYWLRPGADVIAQHIAREIQSSDGEEPFNAVCHFGDLSYAVGHGYIWDQWGWLLAKMAQYIPYMVGVGNHEYDHVNPAPGGGEDVSKAKGVGYHPPWGNLGNDSHGECGVPTFYRFVMPAARSGGNSVFWYAFELQLVRFVMLSTEHSLEVGSAQYVWLESVLANTDRKTYPWLVVMAHRPAYSEVTLHDADNTVSDHLRQQLDDLLLKYAVNLMLSGHMHSYQRSCPGYHGGCRADGTATVHVVAGTAGAPVEQSVEFPADFTMAAYSDYGYLRLDANSTILHVDFVTVVLASGEKKIADSVDIPLWRW